MVEPLKWDFGVSRAPVCHYVAVWNTLDEGAMKDNVIPHYFNLGCSQDNAAWCPSAE